MRKKLYSALCVCLTALFLASCDKTIPSVSKSTMMMDTFATVTIFGKIDGGEALLDEALELLRNCEWTFSKTIEVSDVSLINESGGAETFIPDDLSALLYLALYYHELSGGLFDITIGGVAELWDFSGTGGELPENSAITEALSGVGAENLRIDGNTVSLLNPLTRLDLGGIAKGWSADAAAEFLLANGIKGAVIDLGGDIRTIGTKNGEGFRVGIKNPLSSDGSLLGVLTVSGKAVVTSGSYERGFTKDNVLYHHILDPFTGYPRESDLISVTIIAETAAAGDALSTTAFMLGLDKAVELIEQLDGVEAVFLDKSGNITYTSGVGSGKAIPFEVN